MMEYCKTTVIEPYYLSGCSINKRYKTLLINNDYDQLKNISDIPIDRLVRYFIKKNNLEIIMRIADEYEYDFSNEDNYALKVAVVNNSIDILKYLLLNSNIDIHVDNDYCIKVACQGGHYEIVKMLMSAGANFRIDEDYPFRVTQSFGGVLNQIGDRINITKLLIENGADIHAKNDYAFAIACEHNDLEMVKTLLHYGANIHANDDLGLLNAVSCNYYEMVHFLIESGANIHAQNSKALLTSISHGYYDITQLLIKSGCNIQNICLPNIDILNEDQRKIAQLLIENNIPIENIVSIFLSKKLY